MIIFLIIFGSALYFISFGLLWLAVHNAEDIDISLASIMYAVVPGLNTFVVLIGLLGLYFDITFDIPEFGDSELCYKITRAFFLKKC